MFPLSCFERDRPDRHVITALRRLPRVGLMSVMNTSSRQTRWSHYRGEFYLITTGSRRSSQTWYVGKDLEENVWKKHAKWVKHCWSSGLFDLLPWLGRPNRAIKHRGTSASHAQVWFLVFSEWVFCILMLTVSPVNRAGAQTLRSFMAHGGTADIKGWAA